MTTVHHRQRTKIFDGYGKKKYMPIRIETTRVRRDIRYKFNRPYTPRYNGKVVRSHREDRKRFYDTRSFCLPDDFGGQLAAHEN